MKTIDDFNFEGKKALIRVDFNVPLDGDFKVTDTSRIEAAKPTILKVLEDGGSAVLMSHLGRPKGKANPDMSLSHIWPIQICPFPISSIKYRTLSGCR